MLDLSKMKQPLLFFIIPSIFLTITYSTSESIKKPEKCETLDAGSAKCEFNTSCVYGELNTVYCQISEHIDCQDHSFKATFQCLYCWQLPENKYHCTANTTCEPNSRYLATCYANSTVYCLGNRRFERYKICNIDTGHRYKTAVSLSVLFGGFGVDRFYMGHWQEGVGKLFSFGGFGVWTLIDAILVVIGYLKPADASQYRDD